MKRDKYMDYPNRLCFQRVYNSLWLLWSVSLFCEISAINQQSDNSELNSISIRGRFCYAFALLCTLTALAHKSRSVYFLAKFAFRFLCLSLFVATVLRVVLGRRRCNYFVAEIIQSDSLNLSLSPSISFVYSLAFQKSCSQLAHGSWLHDLLRRMQNSFTAAADRL